jgi:threonine/homoserine/homoserine lactone efflux protein
MQAAVLRRFFCFLRLYNHTQLQAEKAVDGAVLLALAGFAFAATITPGPNNIMVMASGANFGFRRSMPHLCGVSAGVLAIILLVGLGLILIFDAIPLLQKVLPVASAAYLLWLAWKIANAVPAEARKTEAKPFSFVQAAAFQWVNPKVWATGLSAITLYAPEHSPLSVMLVAAAFAVIGLASNAVWTWMGTVLRRWLSVGHRLRMFNVIMATLLVASLYPVFFH